jgi:hypothetical protein
VNQQIDHKLTKHVQSLQNLLKTYLLIQKETELYVTRGHSAYMISYKIVDQNGKPLTLFSTPSLGYTQDEALASINNYTSGLATGLHLVKTLLQTN